MPRQIALAICVLFIAWLYYRDRKLRPMTSIALYIPLVWVIMLCTRGFTWWLGGQGIQVEKLDDYLEGSPFERNALLCLLAAGLVIVILRLTHCLSVVKENKFFLLFFFFCGISCLWSDYPFTAFKRYTKDFTHLVMALIILTETDPKQAIKSLLAKCAYIAIPLSVLFIIYFPEYGRNYSRWTGEVSYTGITTNKNSLGQVVFICGIFLAWDLIETLIQKNIVKNKLDLFTRYLLLAMVVWLLYMAHSSTAVVCMLLGTIILFFMRTSFFKNQIKNLGIWTIVIFLFVLIIYYIPGLIDSLAGILGRNITLTGRTDLWKELLAQPINPLLGSGFQSFWQTPEAARLGEKYYFIPNQAHNGYLEVYIQTGLIGLFLLLATIIVTGKQIKNGILMENPLSRFFFPFYFLILVSNWTEATFNKMSVLWFILMMIMLYRPRDEATNSENDNAQPEIL